MSDDLCSAISWDNFYSINWNDFTLEQWNDFVAYLVEGSLSIYLIKTGVLTTPVKYKLKTGLETKYFKTSKGFEKNNSNINITTSVKR